MGKKILFGVEILLVLVALTVVGFLSYGKLHSGDIKKVDDSALNPASPVLSKEDNAYYDLKQASDSLVFPQDKSQSIVDLSNGTNWDDVLAIEIVSSNELSIAAFNRISWKKGYQDPGRQASLKKININTTLKSIVDVKKIAQISAIKSYILFEQGKEKEAFDNTFNILYFGQMLEDSPREVLANYLVGMEVKSVGLNTLQSMVSSNHLSSADLKNYRVRLEKFKKNKTGLQEALRMEYAMLNNTKEKMIDVAVVSGDKALFIQTIEKISGEALPFNSGFLVSGFYYKPNQTQKMFVEQYQNFVNNAERACNEIVSLPKQTETSMWRNIFTENVVGKILTDVSTSNFENVFDKRCQEEFSVIKTQIALASQAYKNDNGSYPASFNLLSPNYLSTIDKQYDGKDIVYNANNGTVSLAQ